MANTTTPLQHFERLNQEGWQTATFAGGCFWCLEAPFEEEPGVEGLLAGYTGGRRANPTYEQVLTGVTGHRDAVRVWYDPTKITYQRLLDIFWLQIDPTDPGGQFADRGEQYKTAIYFHTQEQQELAAKSKQAKAAMYDTPIATDILPAAEFYPAEEYHQSYYRKDPDHYYQYQLLSGRKAQIEKNKELLGS
jgi:methionine-S-sulfoxide reductase